MERRGPEQRGLEAGHEAGHVKRSVYRRAVQKDELHVRGGTPQVEHVGGARRIVPGEGAHCCSQGGVPHPGGQVEGLDLELGGGEDALGPVPGGDFNALPVGPDLDRVEPQRPARELQVNAHRGIRRQGDLDRHRLVAGVAHAQGDHAGREAVEEIAAVFGRLHPPPAGRSLNDQQGVREHRGAASEHPRDCSVHGSARGVRGDLRHNRASKRVDRGRQRPIFTALARRGRDDRNRSGKSSSSQPRGHDRRHRGGSSREHNGEGSHSCEGGPRCPHQLSRGAQFGHPGVQFGTRKVTRLSSPGVVRGPDTSMPVALTTR